MRFNAQFNREFNRLTKPQRAEVDAIVKRHTEACQRQGVKIESLDRVWIEAMELVRLNDAEGAREPWDGEPARSYPQYVSPKDQRVE